MGFAAHVGCCLGVDTDGIEGAESEVDQEREERREGVSDVHDHLAESDEKGEHGDDDVVVRDAAQLGSIYYNLGIEDDRDVQLTPWQRRHYRSVVRGGIDQLIRVAVPSVVRAFLP